MQDAVRADLARVEKHELALLTILALLAQPIHRRRLARVMASTRFRVPKRKPSGQRLGDEAPSFANLLPILRRLARDDWVAETADEWTLHGGLAHDVLEVAAEAKNNLLTVADKAVREELRWSGPDRDLVAARTALYQGDIATFEAQLQAVNRYTGALKSAPLPFFAAFAPSRIDDVIDRLTPDLQESCLDHGVELAITDGFALDNALADRVAALNGPRASSVRASALILYELLGQDLGLARLVEQTDDGPSFEALATRALIRGQHAESRALIQQAWTASTGGSKRKKPRLQTPAAPLLTLVAFTGPPELKAIAAAQLKSPAAKSAEPFVYSPVDWLLNNESDINRLQFEFAEWASILMISLAMVWSAGGRKAPIAPPTWADVLHRSADGLDRRDFGWWAAAQLRLCRDHLNGRPPAKGTHSLIDLLTPRQAWEAQLDAIEADLSTAITTPTDEPKEERLAWFVRLSTVRTRFDPVDLDLFDEDAPFDFEPLEPALEKSATIPWLEVEPRLQKRRKNGWTSGRAVALRRLAEQSADLTWMTAHDRRIAATIGFRQSYYDKFYEFTDKTPIMLVGHPSVFWGSNDDQPVEVVLGTPALLVDRLDDDRIRMTLQPSPPTDTTSVWCEKTGTHQLTVYSINDVQQRLARRISAGLEIPTQGHSRVQSLLARAAGVLPVHSDLIADSKAAVAAKADPRPVVELDRSGQGIRARFAVYPLGLDGPRLRPGHGSTALVASVDGEIKRCERDLAQERRRLDGLREMCPTLDAGDYGDQDEHIDLPDVSDALDALDELRTLGDDALLLWKKGTPLTVSEERTESALRMALSAEAAEWFSATGSLEVDEGVVLELRAVLDLLPRSRGRYVPLEDSRFLALSDSLMTKLKALSALDSDASGKAQVKLHPVAAGLVAGWSAEVGGLKLDKASRARLRRAQEAVTLEPELPKTLEADLRPYQQEGFRWLARLAHWGGGACLADDMGLGKTVQALALLLHRAELGPALVVAPTSVCSGWIEQATRFAPTLNAFVVTSAPDVSDAASPWQAYDLAVISYTMMNLHIDALADIAFATVVLDEAQAIKNPTTQRAKAARRLDGQFRLATTGTPVENHLGELWSLMSFLNPGLLGTAKSFERRFGRAVKDDASERLAQLRSLMRPFVLRRKKRDVLKELPPRTEIVIKVEPSKEERAFSEAIRQRALERLSESGDDLKRSAMTILTELTRLRQAACHPALVDPDIGIGSSKLTHLVEIATELVEGGHRMLVFSQFVAFLQHVRASFDQAGLTYQYLDGSTPRADRDRAVQAFQAGEGHAFIISLKAGGTGLNLTGADYVVHLDPWWNPAVDDQASSRAHRMGQKRPVTVYKLVTQGSVEEKVYDLHAEKRELAEKLLVGTDVAQAPDVETLYGLLAT